MSACITCDAPRDEHAEALCSDCAEKVATAMGHRYTCDCASCAVYLHARDITATRHDWSHGYASRQIHALPEVRAAEARMRDPFNGWPLT